MLRLCSGNCVAKNLRSNLQNKLRWSSAWAPQKSATHLNPKLKKGKFWRDKPNIPTSGQFRGSSEHTCYFNRNFWRKISTSELFRSSSDQNGHARKNIWFFESPENSVEAPSTHVILTEIFEEKSQPPNYSAQAPTKMGTLVKTYDFLNLRKTPWKLRAHMLF